MGNCMRHQSSMIWDADDLESSRSIVISDQEPKNGVYNNGVQNDRGIEEVRLIEKKNNGESSKQVKIKITKKQLEELLAKYDVQGMSTEQVLIQLMNGSGECHIPHQSWRPTLQSIPEWIEKDDHNDDAEDEDCH